MKPPARQPAAPPATVPPPPVESDAIRQFCTFLLDGRRFGVDILDVQEVALVPGLTPVHHAPPQAAGVVNIRGQIVLCLCLRRILGMAPSQPGPERRLLLFKPHAAENVGALVDAVGDIVEIPAAAVEERNASAAGEEAEGDLAAAAIVRGVCKLEGELMLVLDPAKLLTELDAAFTRHERGTATD